MNHLIVFVFISSMCIGLNEASCKKNHVVFHNQLIPGSILSIDCKDNMGIRKSDQLSFNATPYIVAFSDYNWADETRWTCIISHGPNNKFYYGLEVYHSNYQRCGQLRSWIARVDGIWFTRRFWDPPGWVLPWKTQ
ncbi:hypothetical protein YC2023_052441 [Brassica napus]|uniref:Uncharacterized protein n=1 Tax=Brassica oleracea TaxID=3712 RepID=A0A3P6CIG4_BRAOL|nr:unnamed protein product [Brassica oleracea]